MVAEVQTPIIGASLHFRTVGTLELYFTTHHHPPPPPPSEFTALLAEFPEFTQPHNYLHQPAKHDVTHSISTSGQPVAAKARRLAPEWLRAAKKEFQHMLDLGIIQPSNSSWSSPLHMVPKKSGEWRP